MGMIEELKEAGINTDEALKRFMNNEALYEKMLRKLPNSMNGKQVLEKIDADDVNGAIETAHTLKGVLGNLSITPLFEAYTDIVTLLRQDKPQEARKIVEDNLPVEEKVRTIIENN